MTIGGGIALIVIGAILAYAVADPIAGINFEMIGYILMAAGVVGAVVGVFNYFRRPTTVVRERPVEERPVEDRREVRR